MRFCYLILVIAFLSGCCHDNHDEKKPIAGAKLTVKARVTEPAPSADRVVTLTVPRDNVTETHTVTRKTEHYEPPPPVKTVVIETGTETRVNGYTAPSVKDLHRVEVIEKPGTLVDPAAAKP